MSESERELLKDKLNNMPKKIFDREVECIKMSDGLAELILRQKTTESRIIREVSEEIDQSNISKKAYTNDVQRKTETNRRLKEDVEYQDLFKKIDEVKKELETKKLSVGFLKRIFRSAEALTRLEVN